MASSTRWRINVSASNAGSSVTIGEVEMASVAAGTDLCTGGTAVANSIYSSTYDAAKAFDDNLGTRWNNDTFTMPATLEYQFASAVNIVEYRIKGATDYIGAQPSEWNLEYWDGSSWLVADSRTGQTGWSLGESRTYSVPVAGTSAIRVTQDVIETLSLPTPTQRVTQLSIETLSSNFATASMRVTQDVIELLTANPVVVTSTETTQFYIVMP